MVVSRWWSCANVSVTCFFFFILQGAWIGYYFKMGDKVHGYQQSRMQFTALESVKNKKQTQEFRSHFSSYMTTVVHQSSFCLKLLSWSFKIFFQLCVSLNFRKTLSIIFTGKSNFNLNGLLMSLKTQKILRTFYFTQSLIIWDFFFFSSCRDSEKRVKSWTTQF